MMDFNALFSTTAVSILLLSGIFGVIITVLSVLGRRKYNRQKAHKSSIRSHTPETLTDTEPSYDQLTHAQCSYDNQKQEVYSKLDFPLSKLSQQVYDNPNEHLQVYDNPNEYLQASVESDTAT